MDVDRMECQSERMLTHDGRTHRFLVEEYKHEGESMSKAQATCLRALARCSGFTVWVVEKQNENGFLRWFDCSSKEPEPARMTEREYQDKVRGWWCEVRQPDVSEIRWGAY